MVVKFWRGFLGLKHCARDGDDGGGARRLALKTARQRDGPIVIILGQRAEDAGNVEIRSVTAAYRRVAFGLQLQRDRAGFAGETFG
jgi:hypothetical protein